MKTFTFLSTTALTLAVLAAGNLAAQTTASNVVSYNQGMRADGVSPIGVTRSDANNALGNIGSPDVNIGEVANNSASVEFVSLGFGGEIVLEFANPICNQAGNDLTVYETSYGSPSCAAWPEKALVYASQSLCQPWTLISPSIGICQNADLDLGVLSWAKYIMIEDITNPLLSVFLSPNQDGFDVDAVVGFSTCDGGAITPGGEYSPNFVVTGTQGMRKNGSPVPASRSIQSKMLGLPQMSDASTPAASFNFFSLGYTGTTTLKFPYTILNVIGADLAVYETTFGDNPTRSCASYPEKATFEGSADGSVWFNLNAVITVDDNGNTLCRDGQLEIPAGEAGINYIRVTDVTVLFGAGSTDAYDIDGIVGLNQCSTISIGAGRVSSTETEIGEAEYGVEVYPNPAKDIVSINVSSINNKDEYSIKIVDLMGRVLVSEMINNTTGSFMRNMNISELPAGIYVVSVESNGTREVTKLIKN
jgi:hypothetical protein